MNLLTLTTSPFFGGPERQMIGLADSLAETAPEIRHYLTSFPEHGASCPFLEKIAESGHQSIELHYDFPKILKASKELRHVIQEKKIDLILANGYNARFISLLAARRLPCKIVGVSRGWTSEDWKMALKTRLDYWMHKKMDHVVAVSEGQAEKIRKIGVPKNRITVIRNAIQTKRFDKIPDPKNREKLEKMFPTKPTFLLGAAGRFSPEKGYDILLEAVSYLKNESFSVGLVLFGDGFLKNALEKMVARIKIENMIKIPGFVENLDELLPHFDIFVQSSHSEGLPNVLLEAMAVETAVVATDVGGTAEVVENNVTGVIVPPNNAQELANQIRYLLSQPDKLPLMGKAGRKRVENLFSFRKQAELYLTVFEKILQ
ncbi:MAG: glycosyltransferase family 4 protein [Planctomycetaceae bacterium]|jgi:glycosyltransferase involved in cell wall biosynthesis|nr:glycosyltransferase family 4 protein [Planctomycetaceae bacterium]